MQTPTYLENLVSNSKESIKQLIKPITTFPNPTDITNNVVQNAQLLLYKGAFKAIIATLEARDGYTCHHSERVEIMSQRFCKCMNLMPNQIQIIEVTASVHDIGKVGIGDSTLNKPGKLDDIEWQEMKSHTVIGEDILNKAGKLETIAKGVRAHHERWDGNGYPDGLKGTNIPYSARVIAICDSTDAMMSTRVYRGALSAEECKKELEKGKGVMYQPDFVDIFLSNWEYIVGDLYNND